MPEPADHETVAVKQEPAAPEQESAAQVPEPADHETVAVKQEPAASEPEPADQETVALQQEPAMDGQAHADLQLEVKVNGYPLNAIGAFALLPDGRIGSPRSELREIGVAVPDGNPEDIIPLDSIAGLSYVYDEENQVIDLEISEAVRRPKELDAAQLKGDLEPTASYGMVLNYTAFGAASYNIEEDLAAINGGSLNLDARAFSPFGTLRQTGIVGTTTFSDFDALRLDTSWTYSDEKRALTAQLGDIVSGGLSWTRPVRLGGAQIRRNFRVRPDLITMPVPVVEGSARVPSTLDVYIDGMKAYSGALQEGPFRVDNLPVYTQDGTMRVVLTDSTGREVVSESEFITSPDLLKRNLYDFSIEAGAPRRDFGIESFGYDDSFAAVASFRYGITNDLTGEGHAEYGEGLVSGGAGFLFNGGKAGMFSGAAAASMFDGDTGYFLQAGWEGRFGGFMISANMARSFGQFTDLAAVTAVGGKGIDSDASVPRALDRLALSYSLPALQAGVGASFVHREMVDGTRALIISGSYSQTLFEDITVFGTAYGDFGDEEEFGVYVGASFPLGKEMTGSASGSFTDKGTSATAEVSRSFDEDDDIPYAWRVAHAEGETRTTAASGAARFNKAALEASMTHQDSSFRADVAVDGSLAMAGGSLIAGRRIDDAFAVVNVGAPDVPVEFENRYAGKTGKDGRILLTQLNSYARNKIAIDVADLPITADVAETEVVVVPREMSGVAINFGVKAEQSAALVELVDPEGKYIPESSEAFLEGASEPFIVGYDGKVYLTGIGKSNSVTVKYLDKECRAQFDFDGSGDAQTAIGPVTCG